jgi:hypothetical protein
VQDALLISASVGPFSQRPQLVSPFDSYAAYGAVWSAAVLVNCLALTTATMALGYLLATPNTAVRSFVYASSFCIVPSLLTLVGTFIFLVAIVYSTLALYGWKSCIVAGVFLVVHICMTYMMYSHMKKAADQAAAGAATGPSRSKTRTPSSTTDTQPPALTSGSGTLHRATDIGPSSDQAEITPRGHQHAGGAV